jgi:3-methyladenine DNA glycosylase/8-oxoguanine DNA glycosylase
MNEKLETVHLIPPLTLNPSPSTRSHVSRLTTQGPFNLEATVRLLQRRPTNQVDRWVEGRYARAIRVGEGLRLVTVANAGSTDLPDVRMEIAGGPVSDGSVARITTTVRWMLGLDAPPAPTEWLVAQEPLLAPTLKRLRGFRTPCFPDLFATCLAVLPYQQLSLDAGTAILGRLVERFGSALTLDGAPWYDFPAPAELLAAATAELIGVGLSRAKTAAIQSLARAALAGELDLTHYQDLPTAEAMSELQRLPGIGPWSAGLIMLRGLRRLDIFPAGDTGAAKSLTALLELPAKMKPAEAVAFADRFDDRRGYLYFLCLGSRLPWLGEDDGGR